MSRVASPIHLVVAAILAGGSAAAQTAPSRVLVLDQQARSLTALALPSGRPEQTTALQGTPTTLLRTADGQRLLVLDPGEGRDEGDKGFKAKTRAALTIVDGRTLAVRGRVELGWGLVQPTMLSAGGDRLSVVGPGFQGRSPAESLAREVVTVDLAAGTLMSRIELPRRATAFLATPDGRTAVVLSAREEPRKAPVLPAELRFLDLTVGTVTATVPLEGDPRGPVLSPDGQFLYLLDRGKPNDNPDKNVNGRLHVVSIATRTVQGVSDVGSKPRGLVLDDRGRQLFMLSDGTPIKGPANPQRPGELRVIRGAAPAAPIAVPSSPERLEVSADGAWLYVISADALTKLTLPGLVASPPVSIGSIGLVDTMISRDGRRVYEVFGDYFSTVDAATGKSVGEVRTGRTGKKMLLALETGLQMETARLNAENPARRDGRSYYSYTEYTLREPRGAMAIQPDGKAVYVLNSQTSDVTVVDAESGVLLEKIAAGGFVVKFMPTAGVALVPSSATVHVVDLATRKKRADVVTDSQGQFNQAELSPDSKVAVISGAGGVLVVDATSGKPVGTMKAFVRVVEVITEWGGPSR